MTGPILIKKHGVIITQNSPLVSKRDEKEYADSIVLAPDEQKEIGRKNHDRREEEQQNAKQLEKARLKAISIVNNKKFRKRLSKEDYPSEAEIRSSYDPMVAVALVKLLKLRGQIIN